MTKKKEKQDPNVLEQSNLDKESTLANLKTLIAEVFMDAQKPEALLRVDAITLRDIQLACCLNTPRIIGQPEDIDFDGETRFLKLMFKMVNVVIGAKKKELTADRVQRFIAGFIQYIQSKDEEAVKKTEEKRAMEAQTSEDGTDDQDEYETITSRFVESFLRHLFRGFSDTKTSVRYRCCQILALSISSMGELDEDLYQELRTHLLEVYLDKEPSVRAQACTALCRLQGDPEVDPADGRTILEKLMWSVRHDTSPEVRRLILFNIEVTADALPHIVRCIRDPDNINRKVVYLKPLSNIEDFRMLDSDQKYQVLKWGLNDRNELVQKAAYKMFSEKWIVHADNNLIEFLERLEATKPLMAPLVEKLLKTFFKDRRDIVNEITFDDEFWSNLTGESALLSKVVIEFLQSNDDLDERLDTILPEVTRHVFNLENYCNLYQASLNSEDAESTINYEFIVTQMLDISLCLDYADEVGRRKMFEILRNILRSYTIIDIHLEKVVRLFRMISINERDFTRSIIEIISDIQETPNDSFADTDDNTPTKRVRLEDGVKQLTPDAADFTDSQNETVDNVTSIETQFRCLKICKLMLENSYEPLTENSNLYGLLNDLIVPAVQNADVSLREEGLHCLGLCCILDKRLAQHNIALFLTCIQHGHENLGKKSIRILSDILLMYGLDAMMEHLTSPEIVREVFEFGLDHDDTEIQSLTTQGLCKLMLLNRYQDKELLRLMVLLYFFPKPADDLYSNNIHQCLAYFFPAYCYSSLEHQKILADVTLPALEELCNVFNDLRKDETMTHPKQISEMLADWNDPRKIVNKSSRIPIFMEEDEDDEEKTKYEKQGILAIESLQRIYNEEEGVTRRIICHFFTRLYLDKVDKEQLIEIKKLADLIYKEKPIKLVPTRLSMSKVIESIDKILDLNSTPGL